MTIRSFIALSLPQDTANQLGDLAAKMSYQDKSGALRWVDQENYHITLAFLGEQHQQDLETLAEHLDQTILQTEFTCSIERISPFPETKPKLMAALLERNEDLLAVQRQVVSAVNVCGMRMDKRKFIPHVTLARYRHSRNEFAGVVPTQVDCSIYMNEVILYESVLTSSGAEYEPIYRFPLDFIDFEDQYRAKDV
ncbi:MAG: RNA 2',3'-cyclic phosphodiesterase [Acidiferrobacterales bacterium]|nr:RNA 2',3'-cyclic phosphodiesterase [Acidiferrobacterales bacterium]